MVRFFARFIATASLALLLANCSSTGGDDTTGDDDSGSDAAGGRGGGGGDGSSSGGDGSIGHTDAGSGGNQDGGEPVDATVGSDAATCGHLTVACVDGHSCGEPDDCVSGVCTRGVCQAPTDTDGVKNGGETGVDCGGAGVAGSDGAPTCGNGMGCSGGSDCQSDSCQSSTCVPASCTDGIKNGDETDTDCGGSCAACASGKSCDVAKDCVSLDCKTGSCQAASCNDQIKNGAETATDCGGGVCPACASGLACAQPTDCTSGVCTGSLCQVPTDTDKVKNGDETDTDCGGSDVTGNDGAPACAPGKMCLATTDCTSGVCKGDVCQAPTDTDGVKNGGETGVDCGGAGTVGSDGAPACAPGGGCVGGTDCTSLICAADKCTTPSPTDGVKNGGETSIDCGGAGTAGSDDAPACADGKTCAIDGDCLSTACTTATKVCVAGQSCKASNGTNTPGLDTCGLGETGAVGAAHETCCKSLPLPTTTTVRLDKYEITSGRMRQFLTAIGPNVQSWVNGQIAANTAAGKTLNTQIPVAARPFLPITDDITQPLNLVLQLGAGVGVMNSNQPSPEQGCFIADGAYGAAEYWEPDAVLEAYGVPARFYTQAQLDEKPMNCTPYWMLAAFCAWDGGALPTIANQSEAWGTAQYPWGPTFLPNPYPTNTPVLDFKTTVNYYNNTELFYHFPDYSNTQNHNDNSGYIAAPGRFALDATKLTSADGEPWMDLGANMMEFAATSASDGLGDLFCDYSGEGGGTVSSKCNYKDDDGNEHTNGILRSTGLPTSEWMGGSWEGHESFNQTNQPFFDKHYPSYTFGIDAQYGKTGARCVRPSQ